MVGDLELLINIFGYNTISSFIEKSSFKELLINKKPNIQLKYDEISLSIKNLFNNNKNDMTSDSILLHYRSFFRKYFKKLSVSFISEEALEIRNKIINFYKKNKNEFNILDWYFSFDGIDDSYKCEIHETVDGIKESDIIASQDPKYILDVERDPWNGKSVGINYLRFWEKYLIYINNYKKDLIQFDKINEFHNKANFEKPEKQHINISTKEKDESISSNESIKKRKTFPEFEKFIENQKITQEYILNNLDRVPVELIECYKTDYYLKKQKVLPYYKDFAIEMIASFICANFINRKKEKITEIEMEKNLKLLLKIYQDKKYRHHLFSEDYINGFYEERISIKKVEISEKMKKVYGKDLFDTIWEDDDILLAFNDFINLNKKSETLQNELNRAKDIIFEKDKVIYNKKLNTAKKNCVLPIFESKQNLKWQDVTMVIHYDQSGKAKIEFKVNKDSSGKLTFKESGFIDNRTGKTNFDWACLQDLAEGNWNRIKNLARADQGFSNIIDTRMSSLNRHLKKLTGLDSKCYYKPKKQFPKLHFKILIENNVF